MKKGLQSNYYILLDVEPPSSGGTGDSDMFVPISVYASKDDNNSFSIQFDLNQLAEGSVSKLHCCEEEIASFMDYFGGSRSIKKKLFDEAIQDLKDSDPDTKSKLVGWLNRFFKGEIGLQELRKELKPLLVTPRSIDEYHEKNPNEETNSK
jgi:hypothetical protein